MKVNIFSHCVIDTITIGDSTYELAGGPGCYCGLAARKLKLDVTLHTKFGSDFIFKEKLLQNKIKFENAESENKTTRFKIQIFGADRILFLENKCDPIEYVTFDTDGVLISPVFDEISSDTFSKIKNNANFVFLDPQGFLRKTDSKNKIFLEKNQLNLSQVNAIKTSSDELSCITGSDNISAMQLLQKQGIEYVILTNKRDISLLVKDRLYFTTLPNFDIYDTTGIGDIFSSTFCCTMIKENDFLWAFSFAAGAAQAAFETKQIGLDKIPEKGAIENNGAYIYTLLKFKQV